MSKKKKKPDNVADNPGILPYGSNVGAPAIKPTNISSWKEEKVNPYIVFPRHLCGNK